MEENKTQTKYTWGWTLYKTMLYVMGIYGAIRIMFTLVATLLEDEYVLSVTWSVFLMGILFVVASYLGLHGIREKKKNYKLVLILSIISGILALFTTFKLAGYYGSSDLFEGNLFMTITWILFGLAPPFLLMGSVMQLTNKYAAVNFEEDKQK